MSAITESSPATVLDLRTLPPGERHRQVFAALEALVVGQTLECVNDHAPEPLRLQLAARSGAAFAWQPLIAGPAEWRVAITRRLDAAAEAAAQRAAGSCCSGGQCG